MKKLKKAISVLTLLVILMATALNPYLTTTAYAAATATTSLSSDHNDLVIPTLGYGKSDKLWNIYVSVGNSTWQSFCLTPHGSCHTNDQWSIQSYNAVTYSNQALAKAMTYYGKTLANGGLDTWEHACLQAYIWAVGNGASKQQCVYEAGSYIASGWFGWQNAVDFCNAIEQTNPEGTLWFYDCVVCAKKNALSKHQHLMVWTSGTVNPDYKTITAGNNGSGTKDVTYSVSKKDAVSNASLAGAKFDVLMDGTKVGSLTTGSDGTASGTYRRTFWTNWHSSTKYYVTNWSELSVNQQRSLSASGVYDSYNSANNAAWAEVNNGINNELNTLKNTSHSWTITETKAPDGHYIPEEGNAKTVTENGWDSNVSASFTNAPSTGTITVKKKNKDTGKASVLGTEASLDGAEYTVYAGENILDSDGKTVKYKKDASAGVIKLDGSWSGSLSGLPLGNYYVKETKAPEGFALDTKSYTVKLSGNKAVVEAAVNSVDDEYDARLQIHKTYGGTENESAAVFDIINSKGEVVETLVTDAGGNAISGNLPYGTYTVRQTSGKTKYQLAADFQITVDAFTNGTVIKKEIDNPKIPSDPYIEIIKSANKTDTDLGVHKTVFEKGAKFTVSDNSGKVVATLVTDASGYAKTGTLQPGTYTVHQTEGLKGYSMAEDFKVTVTADEENPVHTYRITDYYHGTKIKIYKTMTKDEQTSPEAAAEFLIYDKSKVTGISMDISTDAKRDAFVESLQDAGAVIGTVTTDEKGYAVFSMDDDAYGSAGFGIVQTSGATGYKMADLQDVTTASGSGDDGQFKVYTFRMNDVFDFYGSIEINKQKTTGKDTTAAEKGAKFTVTNAETGEIVDTVTTDGNGYAKTGNLPYGVYLLHQTVTTQGHDTAPDAVINLTSEYYHKAYTYKVTNTEIPVKVTVTKYDADNGKIKLSKAAFDLTDDTTGKKVATLVTDENGEASVNLKYGNYTLTETKPPKGYKKADSIKITLNESTVQYKDGVAIYKVTAKDAPIYGHVKLTKTAPLLTGYTGSFDYTEKSVQGAEYALYAKEDIKSLDGSQTYYKAGDLVSTGVTDTDGKITFTRTDSKGKETTDMYLGNYYVVETKAPDGLTLDETQHDVSLSADIPDNDIRPTDPVPDTGDATDTVNMIIALTATVKNNTVETRSMLNKDDFTVTAICADGTTKVLTSDQFIINPVTAPKKSGKFTVTVKLNKTALPDEEEDPQTTVDMIAKSTEAIINASQLTTMDPYAALVQQVKFLDIGATEAASRAKTAGVSLMDFSTEGNGSVVAWHDNSNVLYITSYEKGKKIYFDENSANMFKNMSVLSSIDFGKNIIDTSRVTNMGAMFYNCVKLTTLDLSEFDTSSVTTFGEFLGHCEALKSVDISSFDTTNAVNAGAMFNTCSSLTSLDVSNLSFPNATSLGYMFNDCSSLTKLDVSSFDGSKCWNYEGMFKGCTNLVSLNVSRLNTDSATHTISMFYNCSKLASLDVSRWTLPKVHYTGQMFYNCSNLTTLDVSNFKMSNAYSTWGMFEGCEKVTKLDVSNWDMSKDKKISWMFKNCKSLRSLDVSNWDTSHVNATEEFYTDSYLGDAAGIFSGCSSLVSLDLHKWDSSGFINVQEMFRECSSLTSLNLTGWNPKYSTSYYMLFSECTNLTSVDTSLWIGTSATNTDYMFYDCEKLTKIDLGKFNASNVTSSDAMFYNCKAATSINLSSFNTKNDVRMGRMFMLCESLTILDLSAFDTRNVEDMSNMFQACTNLTTLDISSFRTPKLKHLTTAFTSCYKLQSVSMENFDFTNVEDMNSMFSNCVQLNAFLTIRGTKLTAATVSGALNDVARDNNNHAVFVNYIDDATKAIAQMIVDTKGYGHAYLGSLVTTAAPNSLETVSKAAVLNAFEETAVAANSLANIPVVTTVSADASSQEATAKAEDRTAEVADSQKDDQTSGTITASQEAPRLYMDTNISVQAADNSADLPQEVVKDADGNVVEVNYSLDLTDDAQTCRIKINKTDQDGAVLEGATFKLTALVDITDDAGNILIAKGSTIATKESDENGMAVFGPLPTTRYAASTGDMYAVTEVSAPDGYTKDSGIYRFSGKATNNTTVETSFEKTVVNQLKSKVTVKKVWDDGNNVDGDRPETVTVNIMQGSKLARTITLNAANNWTAETDLPVRSGGKTIDYTFEEDPVPAGYTSSVSYENGVATITNKRQTNNKTAVTVKKTWNDQDNIDKIRPSSVQVALYANGQQTRIVTLSAANNWSQTVDGLEQKDADGQEIIYEWKEVATTLITGNEVSGYGASYDEAKDGVTTITNTHKHTDLSLRVEKYWDDKSDQDGIRPDKVDVDLRADGAVIKTVTLSEQNDWAQTVTDLPRYSSSGKEIAYAFEERATSVINGDPDTGYQPSYMVNGNTTVITNAHNVPEYFAQIELIKRIKAADINWENGTPVFLFKVVGTTDAGETLTLYQSVEFTEDYVRENTGSDGYVSLSCQLDKLPLGKYTASEEQVARYRLSDITDIQNGSITKNAAVRFIFDKTHLSGKATYTNEKYEWGKFSDSSVVVNKITK